MKKKKRFEFNDGLWAVGYTENGSYSDMNDLASQLKSNGYNSVSGSVLIQVEIEPLGDDVLTIKSAEVIKKLYVSVEESADELYATESERFVLYRFDLPLTEQILLVIKETPYSLKLFGKTRNHETAELPVMIALF